MLFCTGIFMTVTVWVTDKPQSSQSPPVTCSLKMLNGVTSKMKGALDMKCQLLTFEDQKTLLTEPQQLKPVVKTGLPEQSSTWFKKHKSLATEIEMNVLIMERTIQQKADIIIAGMRFCCCLPGSVIILVFHVWLSFCLLILMMFNYLLCLFFLQQYTTLLTSVWMSEERKWMNQKSRLG